MERIVELSSLGLQSYGGNYSFYAEAKAHERQNALQNLSERKLERQRQEQAMRKQRVRQEQRQARGNRRGKEANQARFCWIVRKSAAKHRQARCARNRPPAGHNSTNACVKPHSKLKMSHK